MPPSPRIMKALEIKNTRILKMLLKIYVRRMLANAFYVEVLINKINLRAHLIIMRIITAVITRLTQFIIVKIRWLLINAQNICEKNRSRNSFVKYLVDTEAVPQRSSCKKMF